MNCSYSEYVPALKALSDETRLKIIDMLSCGELCACKILEKFNITQPTLSYHMRILSESGLICAVRDGAWMRYSINRESIEALTSFMNTIFKDKGNCICKEV